MTATVEQRLADLEQKHAELAAQQDALLPNAFSIGANGEVNETLTGFLEAAGITLQEGSAAGQQKSSIQWLQEAVLGAVISSWLTGAFNLLELQTLGAHNASLVLQGGTSSNVRVNAGSELTLASSGGEADFLWLTNTKSRGVQIGSRKVKIPAGTSTQTIAYTNIWTFESLVTIALPVAPSITSWSVVSYDAKEARVSITSSVEQEITLLYLTIGR